VSRASEGGAAGGLTTARAMALVVVATFAAYWNSFAGAFQFDDYNVIVDNPAVANIAAWWQNMPGIRPLLKLSYAANNAAGGLFGFHAVNLALHAGNALMVYALARQLLGDGAPARQRAGLVTQIAAPGVTLPGVPSSPLLSDRHGAFFVAPRVALLAALLFAVHPVQSEAVTLISGRSMSLMATFYLGSILLHLAGRQWLSLLAFACALAVRETAITLPLALLLVDRQCAAAGSGAVAGSGSAPAQRVAPKIAPIAAADQAQRLPQLLARGRAHWLLAAVAVFAMLLLPMYQTLAGVSLKTRALADNLVTQSAALPYLLGQWLWPLALDADPLLPVFSEWSSFWIGSVVLCLGVGGCGLVAWWRAPAGSAAGWFGFATVWFAVHLAPTNSLLPRLDVANERHLYLAGAGLALAVALTLTSAFADIAARIAHRARIGRGAAGRRLGVAFAALLVVALVVLTQQRNEVYRSEVAFWQDIARKNPLSARAHNNLGYALAQAGDVAAALGAYDAAIRLQPADYKPRLNRRALCRADAARLPAGSCSAAAESVE